MSHAREAVVSVPHPPHGAASDLRLAEVADLDEHRRMRELEGAVETLRLLVRAIGRPDLVEGTRAGGLAGVVVGNGSVRDLATDAVARLRSARQDVSRMFDEHLASGERDVLTARFGLLDGHAQSQADVSSTLRVSTVEVAALEARAMSRLRHPAFADVLESCLGG